MLVFIKTYRNNEKYIQKSVYWLYGFAMVTGSFAQQRAHKKDNESYPKEWKQIARMEQDSFFLTDEARRIAENVLAFQRCTGGWPKNIDMARRMNDKELVKVIRINHVVMILR